MNRSPEINELATALAAAQGEFQAVPRTAENPFFKSKYANLPDVVLAASPILSKHGLSVCQLPDFDGENDLLTTTVMHSSGQWLEASARLHMAKIDPQGQGSAITYMRRYAYSGGTGIVTDEDDDGNAAARASDSPAKAPTNRRAQGTVRQPPAAPKADPATGEIDPNLASQAQLGKIAALFKDMGWNGEDMRESRHNYVAATVGRDFKSTKELTKGEASVVIKALIAEAAAPDVGSPDDEEPPF